MPALSLGVWAEALDEWAGVAADAEAAGFTAVWSQELHRTAFIPLAAAAGSTSSLQLGTAIALAFARSPLVTALEALDLDELCGGRLVLGVGSGVRRLVEDWHGAAFEQPAQRLRETIEVIRAVVAGAHLGEPIEAGGALAATRIRGWQRPFPPVREQIPVYVAAVGPMLTKLAGEVADGWIAHELGSPAYLREQILPTLNQGLRVSARSRTDLAVVASACCVPLSDAVDARRIAAHQVAFYASVKTYQDFFAWHGFEAEAVACQTAFRAGDRSAMVDAISDAMVEALTIAGTPDDVRAKLAAYDGLADQVKLGPPTHVDHPEVIRDVQRAILDLL